MKSKLVFAALALMILAFSGCEEANLTKEELQIKIIDANSNIRSYSFELEMDMDVSADTTEEGMQSMNMLMSSRGKVDLDARKMEIISSFSGISPESNENEKIESKMYASDGFIYTSMMGSWMKMPIETAGEDIWKTQNVADDYYKVIENAQIESFKTSGNHYVIELLPDKSDIEKMLAGQAQTQGIGADTAGLMDGTKYTLWVNKDTFILDRTETEFSYNFNELEGADSARASYKTSFSISDVNNLQSITIPQEALEAKEFNPMAMMGFDESDFQ